MCTKVKIIIIKDVIIKNKYLLLIIFINLFVSYFKIKIFFLSLLRIFFNFCSSMKKNSIMYLIITPTKVAYNKLSMNLSDNVEKVSFFT